MTIIMARKKTRTVTLDEYHHYISCKWNADGKWDCKDVNTIDEEITVDLGKFWSIDAEDASVGINGFDDYTIKSYGFDEEEEHFTELPGIEMVLQKRRWNNEVKPLDTFKATKLKVLTPSIVIGLKEDDAVPITCTVEGNGNEKTMKCRKDAL
jgi:hypothetical protein